LQEKKGALLIVELLYGNLPRREKKEATVPENEIHKILINHCKNIVKNKLEEQYARLMR